MAEATRCPNKNSKEWKLLEQQVKEDLAWATWLYYGEDYPPTLKSTSELRKEIGVPTQINDSNLANIRRKIRNYNTKNSTSHSITETYIGESRRMVIVFNVSYLPVNEEKRRQREYQRSEERIVAVKGLEQTYPKVSIPEEDYYVGDEALREQEEGTKESYFGELYTDDLVDFDNPTGPVKLLQNLKKTLKYFESRLTEKNVDKAKLTVRIENLKNQIDILEDKASVTNALNIAKLTYESITSELARTQQRLDSAPTTDDLFNILRNLAEIDIYIEGVRHINADLNTGGLSTETDTELRLLESKINDERVNYLNQVKESVAKIANSLGTKNVQDISGDELVNSVEDINMLTRELLGTAYSKSRLVQIIDDLIRRVEFNIREQQRELSTTINDKINNLEKHTGLKGDALWDMYLQKDDKGEWTGGYIGRYKQEFFNERTRKFNEYEEGKLSGKDLNTWLKENAHFMTEEELNSGKSSFYTEEEMKEQMELIKQYNEDRAAVEKVLEEENTDPDGVINSAVVNKALEEWDNIHSPWVFSKQSYGEVPFSSKRSKRYILREKPVKKWEDTRFDKIINDPVLFDFYRFMKQTFYDNSLKLPKNKFLPGNYIPELNKGFLERTTDDGILSSIMQLGDDFVYAATDEVENIVDYDIELGSRKFKSIPVHMMNNRMPVSKKSKDIKKVLLAHTAMANAYHQKSKVESVLTASQQLLNETKEISKRGTVSGKQTVRDAAGGIKTREQQLFNTKKQLEYTIDSFLYEERRAVEGRFGKVKLSKEEQAKKAEYDKQLAEKKITKEQYDSYVANMGRQYSISSAVDMISTYTYLNALGLPNFVTPAVNLTFGISSNLIYAAGNEDINLTNMRSAINKMTKALINKSELNKIWAFMEELGVLDDFNETLYGRNKLLLEDKLLFLQNNSEKVNRGMMMLAHLLSFKVKDINGKDVPIYYAFKEEKGKLRWNTELLGEKQDIAEQDTHGEHGVNMFRLGSLIEGANRLAHGDYDSYIRLKKSTAGRVVGMFKQWLWMAVKYRFGEEYFDPLLQRNIKGRYMTPWTAKDANGNQITTKEFLKILSNAAFKKDGLASLSKEDRAAIRRNLKELQFIAQFTLAILALSLVAGGDDDDKFALNLMINFLSKAQADLTFFTNPSAMVNLGNNVAPIFSTVTNVLSITDVAWKTLSGSPSYENGPHKDQNRALVWAGKNMLFSNGAMRIYNWGDRVFEYN